MSLGVQQRPELSLLLTEAPCLSWVFGDKSGRILQERGQIFISRFSVLSYACCPGTRLGPHAKGPAGGLFSGGAASPCHTAVAVASTMGKI